MKLEQIGFYTLSDDRVREVSHETPLQRCELILTDACNFKCPYCRGPKTGFEGTRSLDEAKHIVDLWTDAGLRNIRFSGGEPTVYPWIRELVAYTKAKPSIERIAISTNGSAKTELYKELISLGVNDISISFDACCAAFGDKMAGGIPGVWQKVVDNVTELSKLSYVTLGVVVTDETLQDLKKVVELGDVLGAQDIRIISAAQFNAVLEAAAELPQSVLDKHPILKYRVENIKRGRNVRGLRPHDCHKCPLVLDDMAIAGKHHFPCIIYMREHGEPVGTIEDKTIEEIREERRQWFIKTDTHTDRICRDNCLDVCIDYNNRYVRYKIEQTVSLPRLSLSEFTHRKWGQCEITKGLRVRYRSLTRKEVRDMFKNVAVGWCWGESLYVRPKENCVAVMLQNCDNTYGWMHLTNNEFLEIFGSLERQPLEV